MTDRRNSVRVIAAFTAYPWENVLPVLRILGPADFLGYQVLRGTDYFNGLAFPEMVSHADIVMIQRDFPRYRELYESIMTRVRVERKPVIFDIDDLLLNMPASHPDHQNGYFQSALSPMLRAILEADLVTTTTAPLAAYLEKFHSNVIILPNSLDERIWHLRDPLEPRKDQPITIGYMGTHSHLPDLEMIAPVLIDLENRYGEQVRFKFWTDNLPESLQRLSRIDWVAIREGNYARFVEYFLQQECDIFIAPLLPTSFNACKSSIKFLEYSCLGAPGVYSKLPPYESVVEDGQNGYLAASLDEWQEKLSTLIEHPDLRFEMAKSAQKTVRTSGFISSYYERWQATLNRAVELHPQQTKADQVAFHVSQQIDNWNLELLNEVETVKANGEIKVQELEAHYQAQLHEINSTNQELQAYQVDLVLQIEGLKADYQAQLAEKETLILDLSTREAELIVQSNELEVDYQERLTERARDLDEYQSREADLNARLADAEHSIQGLQTQIESWEARWLDLQQGVGWRALEKARRFRLRLAPFGSRRDNIVQVLLAGLRTWDREGFRSLCSKATRKLFPKTTRQSMVDNSVLVPDHQPTWEPVVSAQPEEAGLQVVLYTPDLWTSASPFLRLVGPSQHLDAGFQVLQGAHWESGLRLDFPDKASLVVIERDFPRHTTQCAQVIDWAHTNDKPLVYEIDDLLLELPPEHIEKAYYADVSEAILRVAAEADAVTVSTVGLAEYFRNFNANTWVLPNYLDDRIWKLRTLREQSRGDPVVVGYMGGITKTHLMDLELVTPVLRRLIKRYGNHIRLRFWGVVPPELTDEANVEFISQTYAEYPAFASYFSSVQADIFIAPLRSNLFNQCKSAIKYLEYSSLAVPGVFSRIRPYEDLVVDGKNGFLASSAEEWEAHLSGLIEDEGLRRAMGMAAQQTIREDRLLSSHAHEWLNAYRSILNYPRQGKSKNEAEVMVNYQVNRWKKVLVA